MLAIVEFLEIIKNELIVVGMAALPIVELRGAIPVGMALGMGPWHAFILAYIGSMLPVPLLLCFLKPIIAYLKTTKLLHWFAVWLEKRTLKKGNAIKKLSLVGLIIYVGVPIPTTGVWTGSGIAALLDLKPSHSFLAIAVGNLIAGLIVMTFSNFFF